MSEEDQERVPAEGGDTFTLASAGDPYGPGSGHDLPPTPDGEPGESVWVPEEESPFGVPMLDCRAFARSMVSSSGNMEVAARFQELRTADPYELIKQPIEDEVVLDAGLIYPALVLSPDGVLFRAAAMEDKWDIYLVEGVLYFLRSWSGTPIYRATLALTELGWLIKEVAAPKSVEEGAEGLSLRMVDFLLRSHAFRCVMPHPVSPLVPDDPEAFVMWSFSEFGRWASYATRSDTLFLGPLAPAHGPLAEAGQSTEPEDTAE